MSNDELKKKVIAQVEILVMKSGNAEKSDDALKFSQAACNAANALGVITRIDKE